MTDFGWIALLIIVPVVCSAVVLVAMIIAGVISDRHDL
jgi:hypothetical protein